MQSVKPAPTPFNYQQTQISCSQDTGTSALTTVNLGPGNVS
jgi:hypothetical protein